MRCALLIIPVLLTAVLILACPSDGSDEQDITEPVFVEETEYGRLYRIDLNDGPLYYYEIDTEHGTMMRIVAFATMTLNIQAEV